MHLGTSELIGILQQQRVLPVIRGSRQEAIAMARSAFQAGARVVELTTTIEDWASVLRQIRAEWPDTYCGLGTVLTAEHAHDAIGSGAHFLVAPTSVPEVREITNTYGIPFIEGGLSPSELRECASRADGMVKLFPAHVGGVKYLSSVSQIIGEAHIMPTGGISLKEVDSWLDAGAIAVGIGSGFPDDADAMKQIFGNHT